MPRIPLLNMSFLKGVKILLRDILNIFCNIFIDYNGKLKKNTLLEFLINTYSVKWLKRAQFLWYARPKNHFGNTE